MFRLLCVLVVFGGSLCLNDVDYEANYADDFNNEIYEDEQGGEGELPDAPCESDMSRWDKVFISLEDAHMRENILLESLEQCCRGAVSVGTQVEKLAEGTCQQCLSSLQSFFRAQMNEVRVSLRQHLMELRDNEAERERSLKETMQQLLQSSRDDNVLLNHLEDTGGLRLVSQGPADRWDKTQGPVESGSGQMHTVASVLKNQEVMSSLDKATMESSLITISRDLLKVQQQLSRVIEQMGTSRKGRGNT